ncbi:MAG: ABC transporter substrate-binding protein [Pseudomonadota bacterium]
MIRTFLAALALATLPAAGSSESFPEADAIVSVGGPITEIIYALGEQDRLVARDTTSVFPIDALMLPDVGYMRRLSAEGVLSVAPDLIIARSTSGPVEALDQLREAAVPVVFVEDGFSAEAVVASVETVGRAIGAEDAAGELASKLSVELAQLAEVTGAMGESPRVLFVLSTDNGRLNASGRGTGANGIIELAGGTNVMADEFEGYRLLNDEAVILAAPDIVLMMDGRGNHSGRAEEVLSLPSLALTPAGVNGAFVTVPGAALGFGPRTPELALDLHEKLAAVQENAK